MQPQNTTLVEPGVYKMDLGAGADGSPTLKYVDKTGAWLQNYKPAMQTTSQQTRQDVTTGQKIDAVAGQSTTAPNANVQNNGQQTGQNNQTQGQQQNQQYISFRLYHNHIFAHLQEVCLTDKSTRLLVLVLK